MEKQTLPKNKLSDVILSSRWTTVISNVLVMLFAAFAGLENFRTGSYELFGMMCGLLGWGAAGLLYHSFVPGLMKSFGEIERATVRAQIEKNMQEALAEIKKRHPEISSIEVGRVQ